MYQIKTEKFEGPLELLLDLIEKEELGINEVSLAKITDGYLEYIERKENIKLENLADFLSVASKLILIKSKTLLPLLKLEEEEEEEIRDLKKQLTEYKKFKDISKKIKALADSPRLAFSRKSFWEISPVFSPPEKIAVSDFFQVFSRILENIPIVEKIKEKIIEEVVSLEEKIKEIQDNFSKKASASFSEIVFGARDKVDVIISFLALLEMAKQQLVNIEQKGLFDEIKINRAD